MRPSLVELIERMILSEFNVSSDDSISWHAHREAEKLNDLSMVEELDAYLAQKPKKHQRAAAYFIIGKIGKNCRSAECASRLIAYASAEQDKYVLSGLLDRLAELPKPNSVDIRPLFPLLKDKRWLVRHAAIGSLKDSTSTEVEDKLLELLKDTSDPYDMIYCHVILNRIGTRKSLPALAQGLKSRKRDVKYSAQAAIEAIEARDSTQQGAGADAKMQHESKSPKGSLSP